MSRVPWIHIALSLVPALAVGGVTTDRDRVVSEADTFYNLYWELSARNILNDPAAGTVCPYTTPGIQRGMAYKVGGFDTVQSFLDGIALGAGAGDNLGPSVDPRVVGIDCSGFIAHAWDTDKLWTWTIPSVCTQISPYQLRMGDVVNQAGFHVRLFLHWVSPTEMLVYESTIGTTPSRVVQRVIPFPLSGNPYIPYRYQAIINDPEPVVLAVRQTGQRGVDLEWDGEATVGYRIQRSVDGRTWSTVLSESSVPPSTHSVTSSISANTDTFLRVAAVNSGGSVTPVSDAVAIRISSTGAPKVLIVDGLDSWRHRDGVDRPGHTFVLPIAQSLGRLGYAYETCANETVVINQIDLSNYAAVIWLTGEDSVLHESLSESEQYQLRDYLEGGGKLLLSGANIAYDLAHRTPTAGVTAADEARFWDDTDASFLRDYLHVDYRGDSTERRAVGEGGTPLGGITLDLDDGTRGSYAPRDPDIFAAVNGGATVFRYPASGLPAAVGYHGTFGNGNAVGTVVTLGFPLETVTSDSQRDALLSAVLGF